MEAGTYLAILIFAGVSVTVAPTPGAVLVALGDLRAAACSGVVALGVALVAFPVAIPAYGGIGAVSATTAAAFTGIGIRFAVLRRSSLFAVPWATLLRVTLVTPLLAFVATLGPTSGIGLVVKLRGCLVLGALLAGMTGEFGLRDIRARHSAFFRGV